MMRIDKELRFICAQPVDKYFLWQVHLWLESLKELGKSNKAIVLVFVPRNRDNEVNNWESIISSYPEVEFGFYKDEHDINKLIGLYIPILRPYILMRYFKEHPELSKNAVFYCDSDILFTERFNIEPFVNDDICYLSDTNSYINASYFDSKTRDVKPGKLAEYTKRDILEETCQLVGISRDIAQMNNNHSGGTQYLLKNIDSPFWEKVLTGCIRIKLHLQEVNKEFFENESKGFQSWTADMWSVLWNLWLEGKETKVVPELDFAWSSDPFYKVDEVGIFHNAGIVSKKHGDIPVFYKGAYHTGSNPFIDRHLHLVYNNEQSKSLANWYYVNKLIQLQSKYNINYLN